MKNAVKKSRFFRERYAVALIMLAFISGMLLTAATSGCDSARQPMPIELDTEGTHS